MKKFSISKMFLITAIVILSLSFALFLIMGVIEIRDNLTSYSYKYSESDYLYLLQDENYTELMRISARDESQSSSKQEFWAIANYYEAATLYHAYENCDMKAQASEMKERMNDYEQEVVQYHYYIELINDRYEIAQ